MKTRIFCFSLLILAACTPMPSPHDALTRANREFTGHDVGEFFIDYGPAMSSKMQRDGGRLYRWLSIEPDGGSDPAGYISYPGGHYAPISGTGNGQMMNGYCEISILTTRNDRIKKLTLISDSIGKFSGSRCAEIFEQGPE